VTSARSCLGNTIDGNIFNKHNDQGKKDISKKDLFHLHGIYSIQTSVLISSCNFDFEKYSLCVYVRKKILVLLGQNPAI
jgi:hypothetical protein